MVLHVSIACWRTAYLTRGTKGGHQMGRGYGRYGGESVYPFASTSNWLIGMMPLAT